MAGRVARWILTVLMLAAIALVVSSPAALGETHKLDLDMNVYGDPMQKDGWISKNEYQDESIHVTITEGDWNDDFLDEVCGFPSRAHDEYVDILTYAINDLKDTYNDLPDIIDNLF